MNERLSHSEPEQRLKKGLENLDNEPSANDSVYSYEMLGSKESREAMKSRMRVFLDQVHKAKPGAMIFLDKSARPVAWMLREMWGSKYPDDELPMMKFINIGRYEPGMSDGGEEVKDRDRRQMQHLGDHFSSRVGDEQEWIGIDGIGKIRASYINIVESRVQELRDSMGKDLQDLNDLLIVDEFVGTGASLTGAMMLVHEAFPNVDVKGTGLFSGYDPSEVIPWQSKQKGDLGIIEDGNALFSVSASPENIERAKNKKEEAIDEYCDYYKALRSNVEEALGELLRLYIETGQGNSDEASKVRGAIGQVQDLPNTVPDAIDWYESIKEFVNVIYLDYGDIEPEMEYRFEQVFEKVEDHMSTERHRRHLITPTVAALRGLPSDISELNKRKKKLRGEVLRLAREVITEDESQ